MLVDRRNLVTVLKLCGIKKQLKQSLNKQTKKRGNLFQNPPDKSPLISRDRGESHGAALTGSSMAAMCLIQELIWNKISYVIRLSYTILNMLSYKIFQLILQDEALHKLQACKDIQNIKLTCIHTLSALKL